ncbi:hypothetical protein ACL02S_22540 [Nocardia sp. 004]|uniref:hypothetical protein n=1 Tax=Nocardia sp. 004 TaxID=3385978 RepID=UPI0039A0B379
MSEDSKQLSVAELLARNGRQGGAATSGGRRRRNGRGISVAELTGDLPIVRENGHSAHAAPDSEAEEPAYPAPAPDPSAPEPVSITPEPSSYGGAELPPPSGGRRRRAEPAVVDAEVVDQEAAEARRLHEIEPLGQGGISGPATVGSGTDSDEGRADPGAGGPEREPPLRLSEYIGIRGGRAARRRAAEAAAEESGPSTAAWTPATGDDDAPDPETPLGRESGVATDIEQRAPGRSSRRNGTGGDGLPAWSARRNQNWEPSRDMAQVSGGIPTAALSLASQDQQLVSGQTVAGDLLRDGVERAERAGGSGGERDGRSSPADITEADGATDVHEPIEADDEQRPGPARAVSSRRSRATKKSADDANRRQWLILGGQSVGAAIAGMLLFKGFERMWEVLPLGALALATIVILGLVALVRILRRTDDILSIVIAVVVGTFVTLGPLAFLLSTS